MGHFQQFLFQFSVLLAWFPEGIKSDESDKAKSRRGTLLRHFIYSVSHSSIHFLVKIRVIQARFSLEHAQSRVNC